MSTPSWQPPSPLSLAEYERLLAMHIAAGESRKEAEENVVLAAMRRGAHKRGRELYNVLVDEAFRAWRPTGMRKANAIARKLHLTKQLGSIDAAHAIEEAVDRVREKVDRYVLAKGPFNAYMGKTIENSLKGTLRSGNTRRSHEVVPLQPHEPRPSNSSDVDRVHLADGLDRLPRSDEERDVLQVLRRAADGEAPLRDLVAAMPDPARFPKVRRDLKKRAIRNELRGTD